MEGKRGREMEGKWRGKRGGSEGGRERERVL
jgi:hypothetical protein